MTLGGKIVDIPNTPEEFAKHFVQGKKLPISRTRLEVAVRKKVGDNINKDNFPEALAVVRNLLKDKTSITASASGAEACPRCLTIMISVVLAKGIPAYYCTNDKVTLPKRLL
jgi:hypothetical protein